MCSNMEKVTPTVDRLERFKRLVFIGNKNSKFLDFSSYFLRRYTRPLVMAAIALCATYRFIGFVFYVYGNKMEPALSDGDLVIGEAASVWGRCLWREGLSSLRFISKSNTISVSHSQLNRK